MVLNSRIVPELMSHMPIILLTIINGTFSDPRTKI